MPDFVVQPPAIPSLEVAGSKARFPVRRIFCVGANYADHVAEMGGTLVRDAPWFFAKSAHHAVSSPCDLPFALGTEDYQYETELALAIARASHNITADEAMDAIFGFGVALDMTRRDLQRAAKEMRRPWTFAKDVEAAAVFAPLAPAETVGDLKGRRIWMKLNGEMRQDSLLDDMVWSVPEIVSHLSKFYHLQPGDVIMTGTPAGVGQVHPGDVIEAGIDGVPDLRATVV